MSTPIVYHGVDLVDIDRIAHAVTRWGDRFLRRVFTSTELADAGGRAPSLAARFAAKEATAKALGVGLRGLGGARTTSAGIGWQDVEVRRLGTGQPVLQLYGSAAEYASLFGWQQVTVSLSHARHTAIASVVALGKLPELEAALTSAMVE